MIQDLIPVSHVAHFKADALGILNPWQ